MKNSISCCDCSFIIRGGGGGGGNLFLKFAMLSKILGWEGGEGLFIYSTAQEDLVCQFLLNARSIPT